MIHISEVFLVTLSLFSCLWNGWQTYILNAYLCSIVRFMFKTTITKSSTINGDNGQANSDACIQAHVILFTFIHKILYINMHRDRHRKRETHTHPYTHDSVFSPSFSLACLLACSLVSISHHLTKQQRFKCQE